MAIVHAAGLGGAAADRVRRAAGGALVRTTATARRDGAMNYRALSESFSGRFPRDDR